MSVDDARTPQPDVKPGLPKPPEPPSWDEYWAHQVAEKARSKVLAYFAVLGILVSLLITLYGIDGIKTVVETRFTDVIEERVQEATVRMDGLVADFEKRRMAELESRLQALENQAAQSIQEHVNRVTGIRPQTDGNPAPSLPPPIDLSEAAGPIGDTGAEGAVVGFAVAHAMQAAIFERDGKHVQLSPRSIYFEALRHDEFPGEKDEGTSVDGALIAMQKVGAYLESDWPYSAKEGPKPNTKPAYKISSYVELPEGDMKAIETALSAGKVVIVEIWVTDDFSEPDESGLIVVRSAGTSLTAVAIVGYNPTTAEFKFANCWGTEWGADGYAFIRDKDLKGLLSKAYTLTL